ncbi:hypothetical protein [Aureivirga marina]|uniref:hypothetical protein n=1 Tax=Aureivirga marina TaxID=1182451 RepID=UPI0018CBEE59|nr:hypothetical protein [Aureivirga marina]
MKKLLLLITAITLLSCSKDDDSTGFNTEIYTKEKLEILHGGSTKKWVLENYYSSYPNISKKEDCYVDDIYEFTNIEDEEDENKFIVNVIAGDISCSPHFPTEVATASISLYEESGTVYLSTGRGYEKEDIVKVTFFSLPLVELTEDRIIFSSGENLNNEKVLIFRPL